MSITEVLTVAREEKGYSQYQLAKEVYLSQSMMSLVENGERKLPVDVGKKLIQKLDCGFLAMEMATEYLGYTFVGKLDGENVDLHRSSVKEKTREELQEALDALNSINVVNQPRSMGEQEKEQLKEALLQIIDCIYAALHCVAALCKEYGISWIMLWKKHRAKLKARGYVK